MTEIERWDELHRIWLQIAANNFAQGKRAEYAEAMAQAAACARRATENRTLQMVFQKGALRPTRRSA